MSYLNGSAETGTHKVEPKKLPGNKAEQKYLLYL
jgi:hypothetical protein